MTRLGAGEYFSVTGSEFTAYGILGNKMGGRYCVIDTKIWSVKDNPHHFKETNS